MNENLPEDFRAVMKALAAAAASIAPKGYGVIVIVANGGWLSSISNLEDESVLEVTRSYLDGEVAKDFAHVEHFTPRHGRH